MKKAFGQTVRDLKRGVNKKVLKEPGIKQKVLDATSNDSWGPHGSLLADIAHASRNNHDYQLAMGVLWKRLSDTGKNWRHVYKALIVLEYMIGYGSERVIDEIKARSYQISTLADFQYIDSSGRDQGSNVRKKSQSLVALVNDKERIAEVREKTSANRDKYRNEGRYGDRDDGRSSYGGEREYGYKDDDRASRDEDRYSRDSEDQYGRDGNMDEEHCRRRRSVDHYENGSRGRSSDMEQSFEDDGQSSTRGSGARAGDYSQNERVLQRKYSEQNIGVSPPSYEEVVSESRSPPYIERDGGESQEVVPPHLTESNVDNQVVGVVNESPPQNVEAFDEFDPRGSVSAGVLTNVHSPSTMVSTSAPPASNNSEIDLLGSLSDVFSPNSSANVTSDSTSLEKNGQANSGPAPSFSTSQSSTQPFDDPFGDSPFKAITYDGAAPSENHSFEASFQPKSSASNPENGHNFSFGEAFSGVPNPNPEFHNMQAPPHSSDFPQEQFDTSHGEIDILAGILPPSGPPVTHAPQPNFAMSTSQFPPNCNMYESFHHQATPTDPNMSGQTPFGQASQQHNMQEQTSLQASQQHNMPEHSSFGEASEQHNMSGKTSTSQALEPNNMSGQTFGHASQQHNVSGQTTFGQTSQQYNMSGNSPFHQASQHNMPEHTSFGQSSQQQNMMGQTPFGQASEQHNMSGQNPSGQTSQQHNMPAHTLFGQASQHNNMPEQTPFVQASQEHNKPRQPQQNNMVSPSQNLPRDVQLKNEGFMQQHTHNLSFHPSSEIIPTQPGTTTSPGSQNSHSTTPNTLGGQFDGKNPVTQQAQGVSQQVHGVPSHIPHQTQSGSVTSHIYNNNGGVQFNNGGFRQHTPHHTHGISSYHTSETFPNQSDYATSSGSQTPYSTTPNAQGGPFDGGNSRTHQAHGVSQQVHGGVDSLGTSTTQPLLTPLSGAIEIVPQTQTNKKFEPKSTIWADTLSRGLVNFNISGPKTNPLADIGVDFAAINRKEKRLEKPTTTQQQQVTSTINMGKAMGSGTGLGRAGASAMRPPPNSMAGSNMSMGMNIGGYGGMNQNHPMGMNQNHSMGMGMNMNQSYSVGMGINMNQNQMMGMGMNMNQNQHPIGMGGMNMNMGGYGQGYPMQPQQGISIAPGPQPGLNGAYNPMMGQGGYNPLQQQPYGGGYR